MKIVKEEDPGSQKYRVFTLRLRSEVAEKIDEAAQRADLSRQKLIESILEQVLSDKKFVLKVRT